MPRPDLSKAELIPSTSFPGDGFLMVAWSLKFQGRTLAVIYDWNLMKEVKEMIERARVT